MSRQNTLTLKDIECLSEGLEKLCHDIEAIVHEERENYKNTDVASLKREGRPELNFNYTTVHTALTATNFLVGNVWLGAATAMAAALTVPGKAADAERKKGNELIDRINRRIVGRFDDWSDEVSDEILEEADQQIREGGKINGELLAHLAMTTYIDDLEEVSKPLRISVENAREVLRGVMAENEKHNIQKFEKLDSPSGLSMSRWSPNKMREHFLDATSLGDKMALAVHSPVPTVAHVQGLSEVMNRVAKKNNVNLPVLDQAGGAQRGAPVNAENNKNKQPAPS